jgi:hypothetical protein
MRTDLAAAGWPSSAPRLRTVFAGGLFASEPKIEAFLQPLQGYP